MVRMIGLKFSDEKCPLPGHLRLFNEKVSWWGRTVLQRTLLCLINDLEKPLDGLYLVAIEYLPFVLRAR